MKKTGTILASMVLCVMMNYCLRKLSDTLVLPFWLDSVGVVIEGAVYGPWCGAATGVLSNLAMGMWDVTNIPYLFINALVGIVTGLLYPKDRTDYFQIICTAGCVSIVTIIFCTPLNNVMYGGYTGHVWGDAMYDRLCSTGWSKLSCSILGEAFIEFPDKVVCFFIATLILKIAEWVLGKIKDRS